MREKKFTPGPWALMNSGAIWLIYGPIGERICRLFFSTDTKERLANAHLIAAAPELLEALEKIMEMGEFGNWPQPNNMIMDKAMFALAKAYGETP